jgi:hypothetical protein
MIALASNRLEETLSDPLLWSSGMEKEWTDRAEAIRRRILQLRDSL